VALCALLIMCGFIVLAIPMCIVAGKLMIIGFPMVIVHRRFEAVTERRSVRLTITSFSSSKSGNAMGKAIR
jgi:hypothetical protein